MKDCINTLDLNSIGLKIPNWKRVHRLSSGAAYLLNMEYDDTKVTAQLSMRSKNRIKHVCMLIYYYWPEKVGGAENQCRKLVKQLSMKGLHCTVVTSKTHPHSKFRETQGSIQIIRIPVFQMLLKPQKIDSPGTSPSSNATGKLHNISGKAVRWVNMFCFMCGAFIFFCKERKRIDIIHAHIADWIAGFAGLSGHFLKIPVLCKGALLPVFPKLGKEVPFVKTIEKWRRKIHYIALTEEMKKELIINGVPEDRITVIPNMVEIPPTRSDVADNMNVLYVGNLSQPEKHKAFDVLFDAWRMVHVSEPEAKLIIAGRGPTSTWKKLLHKYGAENSVEFKGFVPDLTPLYRKTAIFILPSRNEGISNALLEAQSWGIPAVASDIPGNRAVIEDQVTGILTPVDDVRALSVAVLSLLRDSQKRKTMGTEARKRMMSKFSPEVLIKQIIETYRKIIFRNEMKIRQK